MNAQLNRRFHKAPLLIGGWTLFWLYMVLQEYGLSVRSGHPGSLALIFESEFIYAAVWCILTPMILALARQFPLDAAHWRRTIWFHLPASFLVAFGHKGAYHMTYGIIRHGFGSVIALAQQPVFEYIDYGAMVYWIIVLAKASADYYRSLQEESVRRARLETRLVQAQLQALQMQLQPHFLFNTLNAISVLVEKDPAAARSMLLVLSDLLRMTLQQMEGNTITLRQELDFLERYLQIERMRFPDRLTVEIAASEELMDAQVPTMILQPLVENAMRHGIAHRRGASVLRISAGQVNGSLQLSVYDNGPGAARSITDGIGLSNTRTRLVQMYGEQQEFTAANQPGGGFAASITIPYSTSGSPLS